MSDQVYIATDNAIVFIDGEPRKIKAGVSRASAEFAKKYPHLFTEVEGVHFDVEQATAAPGEKRGAPPTSGAGSGRDAWAAYAAASGVDPDDIEGASRDDLIRLVDG